MTRRTDHAWLKERTVHIKGIPPEDRTGNGLRIALDHFLAEHGGKVVAVQIVPPFHKILEIEQKKRELSDLSMLLVEKDTGFHCCIPRKYKDAEQLEYHIERYD